MVEILTIVNTAILLILFGDRVLEFIRDKKAKIVDKLKKK